MLVLVEKCTEKHLHTMIMILGQYICFVDPYDTRSLICFVDPY